MSEEVQNLVKECSVIEPLEGRVLLHPLKLRTYETKETVLDDKKNAGKNPMIDEMATKKKIVNVNYAYQRAIVLQVAKNEPKLKIGDTVIYKISNLMEFDLIPGVSMLKNYEIVAIEKLEGHVL